MVKVVGIQQTDTLTFKAEMFRSGSLIAYPGKSQDNPR